MQELIIPLRWEHLDELLDHINTRLANNRFPTILRIRTQTVVEELFYALLSLDGVETALLRCIYPASQSILLQYRNEKGALEPELTVLQSLLTRECTYGVKAQITAGNCMITVGEK